MTQKKVNFVSLGSEALATHRWRVQLPAQNLMALSGDPEWVTTITQSPDPKADIVVFQKHFDQKNVGNFVLQNKGRIKILFDISDDHFDREAGPFYEFMCANCDIITGPTDRMQERIYDVTGRLAHIIPDPISFPKGDFNYSHNPKFLWFGHACNLFSVYKWMNKVPNLTVITNQQVDPSSLPPHVEFIPWAPGVVEDVISEFDIVLIPQNSQPWAKTKSPNRAVDSIFAGKFVITDFEEVYGDLDPYIYLGDIKAGLDFYREYSDSVETMVRVGQDYVEKMFNPSAVTQAWVAALTAEREV